MKLNKEKTFNIVLVIMLPFIIGISILIGSESNNTIDVSTLKKIILNIRLPRTILVICSGILLGGTGCVLQGFFRNPLSDSSVLGISSASSFGGVLGMMLIAIFNLPLFTRELFAFIVALLSVLILLLFTKKMKGMSSITSLLLTGTALSALFSAGTSFVILFNSNELYQMFVWTLGSFNGRGWSDVINLLIPFCISVVILILVSHYLDPLNSGSEFAKTVGVNYLLILGLTLIGSSLATATSVCSAGLIGFIGLISPHIVRKFCHVNHKKNIFLSMLVGIEILLFSDILARRLLTPMELPIGVITSLIGAPIFIRILQKDFSRGNNEN